MSLIKIPRLVATDAGLETVLLDEDRIRELTPWARDALMPTLGRADQVQGLIGRRPTANDNQEALAFLVSQLAFTEAVSYEKWHIPQQYEQLVPIDYSAGEGVDSIRYEVYEAVGEAEDISSKGDDIPEVDVAWADKSYGVAHAGVAYSFTNEELRRAAYVRKPLSDAKLQAAHEAWSRKLNKAALFGNAAKNFTGLFNNALVTPVANPSGKEWNSDSGEASAIEVVRDFSFAMFSAWRNSAYNSVPDTVVVPDACWEYMNTEPMSTTFPEKTILKYLMENNLCKTQTGRDITIMPGYGLQTQSAAGGGRVVYYVKNPLYVRMHVPMNLRFVAPQLRDLKIRVPGEGKYSGVEVPRPYTMYYQDGVLDAP